MPEHYLGCIEYRSHDGEQVTVRRIVCGCGYRCNWADEWYETIENYASHRVEVVVNANAAKA